MHSPETQRRFSFLTSQLAPNASHAPPLSVLPREFGDAFAGTGSEREEIALVEEALRLQPPMDQAVFSISVDRYVAMSALQKAVRLGESSIAAAAISVLFRSGHTAMAWKRLRTIAVEDIGLGDPVVSGFVLWLSKRRTLHDKFGNGLLANLALNLMCSAVKSRDMTDVAGWSTLPGAIDQLVSKYAQLSSADLVLIASNPNECFQVRHAAARAMFPARFRGADRWKRRTADDRKALYEALDMPEAIAFMIEADVAFGGDVLTSAGPMVWALMSGSRVIGSGKDDFDNGGLHLIGGVPASAYDRYTRLGQSVLRKMLQQHQPWRDYFRRHPEAQPMPCMLRALFYTEGGLLRPKLLYDRSKDLYWSILQEKFASTGISSMDEGGWELLELTREAIPRITQLRERALER